MTKLRHNNHYLPACYQRSFADESGRVWVKFASVPEPKLLFPESIGKRHGFYIWTRNGIPSDNVEIFFDQQIESEFALLSRRIKEEQNHFSEITAREAGILCMFVAAQTTRTVAHKLCIEQQAGKRVNTSTFVNVMLRKMHAITGNWGKNLPTIHFYTPLPLVGEQYITGDNPVAVVQVKDNPVWLPVDLPKETITNLTDILDSPRYLFVVALSPYVCVSIQNWGDRLIHLPPVPISLKDVRSLNDFVRQQSKEFVLANRSHFLPRHENDTTAVSGA